MTTLGLLDRGLLPDWLVRVGIRRLLSRRLQQEDQGSAEANRAHLEQYVEALRRSPVAVHVNEANAQHYEIPAAFFERVLGARLKYSCGLWKTGVTTLDAAEEAMLERTVERAGLVDGMTVMDLGCGWGSLTLWIAQRFPNCRVLAVSNSRDQRTFIENRASLRGLGNVEVVTRDINDFETMRRFDRIFSIEMFEHVRNYEVLMSQIASWLRPDGLFFAHLFVHREFAYPFETEGSDNWLGRHFFTGGQMPSADLLPRFQDDMELVADWHVNGVHYARTARAWLENLDAHRVELLEILDDPAADSNAAVALRRWRVFFMACEELWAHADGREWFVMHYLFQRRQGESRE